MQHKEVSYYCSDDKCLLEKKTWTDGKIVFFVSSRDRAPKDAIAIAKEGNHCFVISSIKNGALRTLMDQAPYGIVFISCSTISLVSVNGKETTYALPFDPLLPSQPVVPYPAFHASDKLEKKDTDGYSDRLSRFMLSLYETEISQVSSLCYEAISSLLSFSQSEKEEMESLSFDLTLVPSYMKRGTETDEAYDIRITELMEQATLRREKLENHYQNIISLLSIKASIVDIATRLK